MVSMPFHIVNRCCAGFPVIGSTFSKTEIKHRYFQRWCRSTTAITHNRMRWKHSGK